MPMKGMLPGYGLVTNAGRLEERRKHCAGTSTLRDGRGLNDLVQDRYQVQ